MPFVSKATGVPLAKYAAQIMVGKTLEEIGLRFCVTRERVRQIEARALTKLRQPYRNHSVKSYVEDYS